MNKYVKEFFNRVQKHLIAVPTELDEIYIKLWTEHFVTKMEVLTILRDNKIDPNEDSIKREVCAATFKEFAQQVSNNKTHLVSYMMSEPKLQPFNIQPIDFVKFAMEMDYTVFEKRSPLGRISDYLITTMYGDNALPLSLRTLNVRLACALDPKDFTEIDHVE